MSTRNVQLTDDLDRFIEAGIDSGRFCDASEIVREGLRLLEEREQEERVKLEWLRNAAEEGFDAIQLGYFTELTSEDELASFMEALHHETVSELTRNRDGI